MPRIGQFNLDAIFTRSRWGSLHSVQPSVGRTDDKTRPVQLATGG